MITKTYNLDKTTYSIYGESALGILNLYKSGNPVTTTTVNLGNGSNRINIDVDLSGILEKNVKLLSVKLKFYSSNSSTSLGDFYISKETSLESNENMFIKYFNVSSGVVTVDVTNFIKRDTNSYFSLRYNGNIQYPIYTNSASLYLKPRVVVECIEFNEKTDNDPLIGIDNLNVNLANGRLDYCIGLINCKDYTPLNLNLVYNLNYYTTIINNINNYLVCGFKTNYNQMIYADINGYYNYLDGNGLRHVFRLVSNNTYYDINGSGLVLVVNSTNSIINDLCGTEYKFNNNGLLYEICYLNHVISINYDSTYIGRINSIFNGNGMFINFVYNSNNIVIKLNSVEKARIYYGQNRVLSYINFNGINYYYTFSSTNSNLLSRITNSNNYEYLITYNDNHLVSSLIKNVISTGTPYIDSYTFDYYAFNTILQNNNGVKFYYYFNKDNYKLINSSELLENQIGIAISNLNDDYTKYEYFVNKEKYVPYVYNNSQIITIASAGSYALTQGSGTTTIISEKYYAFSFWYQMSDNYKTSSTDDSTISISSSDNVINYSFETFDGTSRYVTILFKSITNLISINITSCISSGSLIIINPTIFEVCLNEEDSYSNKQNIYETYLSNNVTFYRLKNINKFYIDNVLKPYKMTFNDLIENQKNMKLGNGYVWYNNKKELFINVSELKININNSNYLIKYVLLGKKNTTYNSYVTNFKYFDFNDDNNLYLQYDENKNIDSSLNYKEINNSFEIINEINYLGISKDYSYNNDHNIIKINESRNNTNISVDYVYNSSKSISEEKTQINTVDCNINYYYDSSRRISQINNQLNQNINYNYDNNDYLTSVNTTIDTLNNQNNFEYNYEVITKLGHNGFNYSFVYDSKKLLNKIKMAGQTLLICNNSLSTNTRTINYANGYYVQYKYDKYDRLIQVSDSTDGINFTARLTYLYSDNLNPTVIDEGITNNSGSKLRRMLIGNKRIIYRYDDYNRLIKLAYNGDYIATTDLGYDGQNRLNSIYNTLTSIDVIQNITNRYVNRVDNRFDYLSNDLTYRINGTYYNHLYKKEFEYNDNLRRISKIKDSIDNSYFIRNFTYINKCNLINTVSYSIPSNLNYGTITYSYDNMGNITTIDDGSNIIGYEYDNLGRLIRENNQKLNKTTLYEYDAGGNITSKKVGSFTTGTLTNYVTYNYSYDSNIKDRLISYNNGNITYDNFGNPTYFLGRNHTWSKGRKLSSVMTNSGTLNFDYNNLGRRTKKYYSNTNNYHKYYYDNYGNIMSETIKEGTNTTLMTYNYVNGEIIGFSYGADSYLYQKNIQNDIIGIMNSSGLVVAKYVYDAWGNHVVYDGTGNVDTSPTSIGNINPIRYRSYYYDIETNYYYLKTRYYVPEICRFLNLDQLEYLNPKIINGLNLFSYCLNNPVMCVDQDGHMPKWAQIAIGIGVGALIVASSIFTAGAIIAAAPAIAEFAGIVTSVYSGSLAAATIASTAVSIGAGALAIGTIAIGLNEGVSAATGFNAGIALFGNDIYNAIAIGVSCVSYMYIAGGSMLPYPSTGNGPSSFKEQLVMEEAMSNPSSGKVILRSLNDRRFPGWLGWAKYSYFRDGIEVHYVGNRYFPSWYPFSPWFDYKIKD